MSRKDYRAIAAEFNTLLRNCTDNGRGDIRAEALADAVRMIAGACKTDNPRFDKLRFFYACGVSENGRPIDALTGLERAKGPRDIVDGYRS